MLHSQKLQGIHITSARSWTGITFVVLQKLKSRMCTPPAALHKCCRCYRNVLGWNGNFCHTTFWSATYNMCPEHRSGTGALGSPASHTTLLEGERAACTTCLLPNLPVSPTGTRVAVSAGMGSCITSSNSPISAGPLLGPPWIILVSVQVPCLLTS